MNKINLLSVYQTLQRRVIGLRVEDGGAKKKLFFFFYYGNTRIFIDLKACYSQPEIFYQLNSVRYHKINFLDFY